MEKQKGETPGQSDLSASDSPLNGDSEAERPTLRKRDRQVQAGMVIPRYWREVEVERRAKPPNYAPADTDKT